jgi:transposase
MPTPKTCLRRSSRLWRRGGCPRSRPLVGRSFGVGISSVKRYVATARQGGRSLAPKKRPGSKPKIDESARRLLEADLQERPAATLPQRREFLWGVRGVEVSDGSTVCRVLKGMGWTRKLEKKIGGCERARRVSEGCLAVGGWWVGREMCTPSGWWCSWRSAPPTPRWHPCRPGRLKVA